MTALPFYTYLARRLSPASSAASRPPPAPLASFLRHLLSAAQGSPRFGTAGAVEPPGAVVSAWSHILVTCAPGHVSWSCDVSWSRGRLVTYPCHALARSRPQGPSCSPGHVSSTPSRSSSAPVRAGGAGCITHPTWDATLMRDVTLPDLIAV